MLAPKASVPTAVLSFDVVVNFKAPLPNATLQQPVVNASPDAPATPDKALPIEILNLPVVILTPAPSVSYTHLTLPTKRIV